MGWAPALWHWILNVTGDETAGTRWNLAWSGFLSAGVISGSIFTHTWHRMREANCHQHGCWRIGTHQTKDGYRLCKKCIGRPLSELTLHVVHEDHQTERAAQNAGLRRRSDSNRQHEDA